MKGYLFVYVQVDTIILLVQMNTIGSNGYKTSSHEKMNIFSLNR